MTGLPSTIDVEKFVEARAFEIDAMQKAMKTANSSSTQRAWQALPRHLRRRAASHDVRRVPLKLRDKARAEIHWQMDPIRKKTLGSMPKRGKLKRISQTDKFLSRQRDKTWLETHLWHAKRMKMSDMWGYRLAVHPTEKAYRPSHRASVHGSILHDASYHSLVEMRGPQEILISMLELSCDPQGPGPGSKRCLGGSRTLETHLYEPGGYPFALIAPVTIIWRPTANAIQEESQLRTVWLRFHPSAQNEVLANLKTVASQILSKYKSNNSLAKDVNVEINDLKDRINVFEIMGPKASQVIKGSLSPASHEKTEDFRKFWSSLTNLQTAGSLPRGMIVGFKVDDPRLNFPPKDAKCKPNTSGLGSVVFPSSTLASSEIWDESIRDALAKPRYKKKELDERRSKNIIPGTPLNPLRQDDRIPVLLIQRTLEAQSSGSDSQALHGWTLIVPSGWSMAFFSSLIFTGTRVAGQRERQTQAYEAGTVYFPWDYPFTAAYTTYSMDREKQERESWERKPPAKRVNYDKLGTISPWKADWATLLGLQRNSQERGEEEDLVTTQRDMPAADKDDVQKNVKPCAYLLSEMGRLRLKRSQEPFSVDLKAADLLQGALVNIKLVMCSRGAPEDLSIIYSVGDEEARRWEKLLQNFTTSAMDPEEETPEELELAEIVPPEESVIGYVTTGHFSLSRGQGFAIGAIPVTRFFELRQQTNRSVA
ncbi:uncharacterized protein LACBIDRAFT_230763 [Laccaria bicolor S238N-H82]|uniref:Predicted protein n=1 Tax=Laccaria bicolor (strain S238N-H82 / ATCC MYA-4686) TaxID=486041 RepID=B0CVT5_LACBS|nr:uncharacterized protein LACBIDRAFT_230763 [Laccaria bicolor S238N-H82]EDR13388.1 predicted protein [Laccaria bicolor S238N-H82]|eukprot:XP_001875886.1 predicted protein [Laccaria bicolor S238N-H82]